MNYQYKISKALPTKDIGAWEREAIKELNLQGAPKFALKLRISVLFRDRRPTLGKGSIRG